jgi:hypothetical protein
MKTGIIRKSFFAVVIMNAVVSAQVQTESPSGTVSFLGLQFNTITELVFCLFAFVLLVGIIAITIHHFTSAERRHQNMLKANIEKLRSEDFQIAVSNDMKRLRSSLIKKSKRNSKADKIENAKKYEIATGEIDLAMKLKSLMNK